MKVHELIDLLQDQPQDADVEVRCESSQWGYNGVESEEYTTVEWGDVDGVGTKPYGDVPAVYIYTCGDNEY